MQILALVPPATCVIAVTQPAYASESCAVAELFSGLYCTNHRSTEPEPLAVPSHHMLPSGIVPQNSLQCVKLPACVMFQL